MSEQSLKNIVIYVCYVQKVQAEVSPGLLTPRPSLLILGSIEVPNGVVKYTFCASTPTSQAITGANIKTLTKCSRIYITVFTEGQVIPYSAI